MDPHQKWFFDGENVLFGSILFSKFPIIALVLLGLQRSLICCARGEKKCDFFPIVCSAHRFCAACVPVSCMRLVRPQQNFHKLWKFCCGRTNPTAGDQGDHTREMVSEFDLDEWVFLNVLEMSVERVLEGKLS